MNISYNWLKQYINVDVEPVELGKALTSIGLEVGGVEEVQTVKGGLEGLIIGEVLTCINHENSDHLHVTTVNVGGEEPLQMYAEPERGCGQKVVVELWEQNFFGRRKFHHQTFENSWRRNHGNVCADDDIGIGTSTMVLSFCRPKHRLVL